ncbi:Spo0B C-terminal domain-containing protein [Fervidibacillus halotolerans]|uniref:Sporulation initiation phosphotransferase B n=1 Tax=Fervidibacillus halotolerans TaxID=2980027 RepID=A0A9E8LYZ0_9BACI|nr:Spo0B C-terminal domain-containing protein [Fervidibacillus halotolerans]WAA11576.1 sporulation initiation phosphotransferase B [Fervidibacillus halotolerans]
MKNWEPIELLRHVRHEWLNKLQLIQSYLSVGNEKRALEIIDETIFECKQEANLSNLPFRKLSTFLLTYPFQTYPILLKYEVNGDGTADGTLDEKLFSWFQQFLKNMNEVVSIGEENELYIMMEVMNKQIRIFIHFTGLIRDSKRIEFFLKQTEDFFTIENVQFNHETLQFSLVV